MSKLARLVVVGLIVLMGMAGTRKITVLFDKDETGKPPEKFILAKTGPGAEGTWLIKEDDGRQVLAQIGDDPTDLRFPVCIYQDFEGKDVAVSIKFKTISGKVDQAAGIVVRYHDKDNYVLLRANAVENNVRFYKVVAGKRHTLAGGDLPVPSGKWQTLFLAVSGQSCSALLDGKLLFKYEGDFEASPGKVGFWTKADSVTEFDELCISEGEGK